MNVIVPKPRDLGGFSVRRILPSLEQRTIGPFVFFDEMGPLTLKSGLELEVRPHPHIGLATLTWLFSGALMHRDSLGSVQPIHPGAVNLMTAGRGIVHSERASQAGVKHGDTAHGAQFWLALPKAEESCAPAFVHHPASSIPGGDTAKVILGEWQGMRSPVRFPSPALLLDLTLPAGQRLPLPTAHPELGVYIVSGALSADGERHEAQRLLVLDPAAPAALTALEPSRLLVIGGAPLDGPRYLDWNFVASNKERLAEAKQDWIAGRFPPVPGETEFIPYP